MSTSYQAMDVRLEGVENALMWIMKTISMPVQLTNPLGPPITQSMDLFSVYQSLLRNQRGPEVTLTDKEEENGTDADTTTAVAISE